MKIGVVFPQIEIGSDPAVIKDYAQTAEGLGYDYLLAYDHVLGANPDRPDWDGWRPYTYKNTFHEPFVLFGYLAGLTERIEFTTGIIILPQRQTALVAKQAAQVDVLSGGRLRLGVGIGWNHVEYQALGTDFHTRGKRIEEQVTLLRELWTKSLVTFDGQFDAIPDAGINPLPVQRPIPVWMGGYADVVLQRMARMADGWMVSGSLEDRRELLGKLRGYLEAENRQPGSFGIETWLSLGRVAESDWANWIEAWKDAGATHISINTMGMGLSAPADHIDTIRRFKEFSPGL